MSDKYFKDKAEEVFNKIKSNEGWGADSLFNLDDPTCYLIYISLKEVARDQRYACVKEVAKTCIQDNLPQDFPFRKVEGIIQNANIESIK